MQHLFEILDQGFDAQQLHVRDEGSRCFEAAMKGAQNATARPATNQTGIGAGDPLAGQEAEHLLAHPRFQCHHPRS
jgi:hypothetical protein